MLADSMKWRNTMFRHRCTLCTFLIISSSVLFYFLEMKEDKPSTFHIRQTEAQQFTFPNEMTPAENGIAVSETSNSSLTAQLPSPITDGLLELFEDKLFAPLLSLYRRKARGDLVPRLKSFRSGNVPRVLVWSRPFIHSFWDSQLTHIRKGLCPLPCEVIYNDTEKGTVDAVIIYLRGAESSQRVIESLAPRDPSQPWIMLTFEAPLLANSIHKTKYKDFNGLFNRTMMYRRDADIRVPHGFIVRRGEEAGSLPHSWVIPPVMNVANQSRKLAVAFISNCHDNSNRLKYIQNLQEYAPVDIYGRCGKLKCGHYMHVDHHYNATQDRCLKIAGENYLFFFAFENSFCIDYITEKPYNLLYYPIVPVVRGSADYSTLFPPNSYLDASKYSPKELAEKLLYLQNNPQEYQKMLAWRDYYQASTIGGERTLCHLCARLYDPDFYQHQVIDDFEDWFFTKSRCIT